MATPGKYSYLGPPQQINCIVQDADGTVRERACNAGPGQIGVVSSVSAPAAAAAATVPVTATAQAQVNWLPLIAIGIGIYLLTKN